VTDDYLSYYDLEKYLFEEVNAKFHRDKKLDAFDLFSIIVWKANRAKSRLAHRLIERCGSLEVAAEQFTTAIYLAPNDKERLLLAMFDWGFYLPMASAILSVLYPSEFTVFDYRVCEELECDQLGDFYKVGDKKREILWDEYCLYRAAVNQAARDYEGLRDRDRFLWGRSSAKQLQDDLIKGFPKRPK